MVLPNPIRPQAGFTLIELLIAMLLATVVSVGLVVAFRMGVQYVERGRGFYADLQELLAVSGYVKRSVAVTASSKLTGDAQSLSLGRTGTDGPSLFRCEGAGAAWVLSEVRLIPVKQEPAKPGEKPPEPELEEKVEPLLDGLAQCSFEYLEPAKADTPARQEKPDAPPGKAAPVTYAWMPEHASGTLAAVRLNLAGQHVQFPGVVMQGTL